MCLSELWWVRPRHKVGRPTLKFLYSQAWHPSWWEDAPAQCHGGKGDMVLGGYFASLGDAGPCKESLLWIKWKTTSSPFLVTTHTRHSLAGHQIRLSSHIWLVNLEGVRKDHVISLLIWGSGCDEQDPVAVTHTWCRRPRICVSAWLSFQIHFTLLFLLRSPKVTCCRWQDNSTASLPSREARTPLSAWCTAEMSFGAWTEFCGLNRGWVFSRSLYCRVGLQS